MIFISECGYHDEICNIPSRIIKAGQIIGVREKSKSLEAITDSLSANSKTYEWLTWDNATYSGTIMNIPSRELIPETIKEQLIVELYSK